MIYKRCGRCGKRLPAGTKCDCFKQRHKEYDKYSRDKKSTAFYHSKEWIRTREDVLSMDDHIDVWLYMTESKIIAADTVHHIDPLKENWSRRCDPDNLISLHHDTHSTIEKLYCKDKEEIMSKLYDILKKYRENAQ